MRRNNGPAHYTRNEVRLFYRDGVYQAGYGVTQNLLHYHNRTGYNAGTYGWNWDLFPVSLPDGRRVAIVTGYRNLTGQELKGAHEADQQARRIIREMGAWGEATEEAVEKILVDLIMSQD